MKPTLGNAKRSETILSLPNRPGVSNQAGRKARQALYGRTPVPAKHAASTPSDATANYYSLPLGAIGNPAAVALRPKQSARRQQPRIGLDGLSLGPGECRAAMANPHTPAVYIADTTGGE